MPSPPPARPAIPPPRRRQDTGSSEVLREPDPYEVARAAADGERIARATRAQVDSLAREHDAIAPRTPGSLASRAPPLRARWGSERSGLPEGWHRKPWPHQPEDGRHDVDEVVEQGPREGQGSGGPWPSR